VITVTRKSGPRLRLAEVLGGGGEGTIYSIQDDAKLAVKLYLPGIAQGRREKIERMTEAKLYASYSSVAYPIEPLQDGAGYFCGFTMLKMPGRKPAHELYSPSGRRHAFPKATFPMLLRATSNIAKEIAKIHSVGCVVGDINHSSVLVSEDATVVLIDSDSFQFSYNGKIYPCKVGVPEFTPPELQGKNLATIVRTENHDYFGLAVLIFYTLMMGRHPFVGRYLGQGDTPSIDRLIADHRFAYSARHRSTLMDPPPNVPTLADLPMSIGDAFECAFGPSGASSGRVSASDWGTILDKAEGELVQCASISAHHYFRSAKSCPWCRMERASPGFQAFAPIFPISTGDRPLDLRELMAAVRAVKDPGPAPDLAKLMPHGQILRSPTWLEIRRARLRRWMGAIVGAAFAFVCFMVPSPGLAFFLGFVVLAISVAAMVLP
jgi:DNA-binding helix-hairpin-helix protein with protein kinase domain